MAEQEQGENYDQADARTRSIWQRDIDRRAAMAEAAEETTKRFFKQAIKPGSETRANVQKQLLAGLQGKIRSIRQALQDEGLDMKHDSMKQRAAEGEVTGFEPRYWDEDQD